MILYQKRLEHIYYYFIISLGYGMYQQCLSSLKKTTQNQILLVQTKKHTQVQLVGCSLFYMTFYQLFDFVQHSKNKRSVSPHYHFKQVNTFDLDFFPCGLSLCTSCLLILKETFADRLTESELLHTCTSRKTIRGTFRKLKCLCGLDTIARVKKEIQITWYNRLG